MNTYLLRMPTEDLTPSEQAQILAHYTASIVEHKTGQFHCCSLCRPKLMNEFWRRYDNLTEADAQEVQEMGKNLEVTEAEFNQHDQYLDRLESELYKEFPFVINRELMEAM